jgi:hypothetical protein
LPEIPGGPPRMVPQSTGKPLFVDIIEAG